MENKYDLTWEEIVYEMQNLAVFSGIIYDSFLTMNLEDNCDRYFDSPEFSEVLKIIKKESKYPIKLLDLAASNGIASYSFAKNGIEVYALESSPSRIVGRGAIEYIRDKYNLDIKIKQFDERKIPFENNFFDIVFERQYLHHAFNMEDLLKEISRVLKPGGIFIGIREHVVDNHDFALKKFYRIHPIHRTYGHERAFKYSYYINNIKNSGLNVLYSIKPYESEINIFEGSFEKLHKKIFNTKSGKIFKNILGKDLTYKIGLFILKIKYRQGRMYSFIAKKNPDS